MWLSPLSPDDDNNNGTLMYCTCTSTPTYTTYLPCPNNPTSQLHDNISSASFQDLSYYFAMAPAMINVLLTSFPGLNLPATLALPVPSTTSVAELRDRLAERIPALNDRLILTTTSNKQLAIHSCERISDLITTSEDEFLSLRLSARMCGGKGGFGSQLRAAGGRMSSKRKRNQGENNGSSRNLDGRRLRTVTEAKALAEYLAIKPDMEKKDKDQRRKRWEQVVELAERREEEIKSGSKGKIDGKWVEDKEEAGERTREAVLTAMGSGNYRDNMWSRSTSSASNASSSTSRNKGDSVTDTGSNDKTPPSDWDLHKPVPKTFFGFDEDDEFMSDEEDEEEQEDEEGDNEDEEGDNEDEELTKHNVVRTSEAPPSSQKQSKVDGKGKGKAKANQETTVKATTTTRSQRKAKA